MKRRVPHLPQRKEQPQRRANHNVLVHREVELANGDRRHLPLLALYLRPGRALRTALHMTYQGKLSRPGSIDGQGSSARLFLTDPVTATMEEHNLYSITAWTLIMTHL